MDRGVYAVGRRRLDWSGRCLAAVLASAPAFASHASAAWIWGLIRYAPDGLDLTAPTRRHPKANVRLHHARLAARDCAVRDAIPVTSVARTLLDLAGTLPVARFERVLERSEELDLFDLGPIDELLGRVTHHPGKTRLRAALEIYRDDPTVLRSNLERRFLRLVRKRLGLTGSA